MSPHIVLCTNYLRTNKNLNPAQTVWVVGTSHSFVNRGLNSESTRGICTLEMIFTKDFGTADAGRISISKPREKRQGKWKIHLPAGVEGFPSFYFNFVDFQVPDGEAQLLNLTSLMSTYCVYENTCTEANVLCSFFLVLSQHGL